MYNPRLETVYRRLALAIPTISFEEFYTMMLSSNDSNPIWIKWDKLDGETVNRLLNAVPGPSGNVKYDYEAEGYMILQRSNGDFNTVDLSSVTRCRFEGRTYFVR